MPCPIPEMNLENSRKNKLNEKPVSRIPNALMIGPIINNGLLPILSAMNPIGKLKINLANANIETANPIELILIFNCCANIGKIGVMTPCPEDMKAVEMHSINNLLSYSLFIFSPNICL
ncbi:MAG: hypothetical protein DK305_000145 [Chloroflexi bacterium]|jgi:hypothetical protein|nr:MAG: hypothetical protein DK305_000145 [Chloroflexota bacterium]|tara:strand:+ start:7136 stop:7492 length:357 start_codon:yes stop_codon:yes gene_type:complete